MVLSHCPHRRTWPLEAPVPAHLLSSSLATLQRSGLSGNKVTTQAMALEGRRRAHNDAVRSACHNSASTKRSFRGLPFQQNRQPDVLGPSSHS